jgi:hypothetical protein
LQKSLRCLPRSARASTNPRRFVHANRGAPDGSTAPRHRFQLPDRRVT